MHAHEKGSGQKGRISLSSRYVYCGPIRLQNHGHMTLVECNYAWSICTHMHLVYAHGTEVAVSFYFTHTGIANYCIPAGCASATLLTRPFLPFCIGGAGHETKYTQIEIETMQLLWYRNREGDYTRCSAVHRAHH